jgi:hypothetical protein
MSDTPRTDKIENDWKESWDRSTGQKEMADFARQLERELNEARAALAAELAMPTHLLDVHAIADQRDRLCVINAELESAIRSFQTDFERIQWGWDGDCGSSRLVEDLVDALTRSKQCKP